MPIYEYRCARCGHQQEFLLKVSDAPLTVCTKCGAPEFSKMVTAAGFQLKGSGWYATDFRNSGSKPAAKSESKKSESKKTESTSESKPESSATPADSKSSGSGSKPEGGTSSSGDSGTKSAAPSCGRGGCLRC
jgi:putative FmdB family regulatory protein